MAVVTYKPEILNKTEALAKARWRGRTDLFWLAREVLQYRDLEHEVHDPVIRTLQAFPMPPSSEWASLDHVTPTRCQYVKPYMPMLDLPGARRRLLLDPRSHYKTTINAISHTIQWLLNYPDATVLIVHAKQEVAEDILSEIKGHFLFNKVFRDIYPDYCPDPKSAGNSLRLVLPNRIVYRNRAPKEPSVGISSIGTVVAGYHYSCIKFSDVVTELNSGTAEQRSKVISSFGLYRNVLISPDYWMDVEGTCYDYGDLYNTIIETESKRPVDQRTWRIHVRGCYVRDTGDQAPRFTPEERDLRLKRDDRGLPISIFPKKFPVHVLEEMRTDPTQSEALFNAQMLNNPIDASGNIAFPLAGFRRKTVEDMRRVPIAYYTTTVDTAETQSLRADFSSIVTCGWDANGRCYVVDARHGKFLPDDLIQQLFAVFVKWRPVSLTLEETGYVRGLKTSIRRYEDLTGVYLPLRFIPRDNQKSKAERILLTLQPWYKRGDIYFSEGLDCLDNFRKELTSFPKGSTDDLIDALSDQFQAREWLGREKARPQTPAQFDAYVTDVMAKAMERKVAAQGEYAPAVIPMNDSVGFFDVTGGL